jgi:protein-tyrosine phosphatase
MGKVLFICTGNYYRSRFAEAVFNHSARGEGMAWSAFSRGLAIHLADGDISDHTASALRERGIAGKDTGPTRIALTGSDLAGAGLIVAMKRDEHRPMLLQQFPEWANRVIYWNVHDIDQAGPEEALREIEGLVRNLIEELRSKS